MCVFQTDQFRIWRAGPTTGAVCPGPLVAPDRRLFAIHAFKV
jgi:hypothetical protein